MNLRPIIAAVAAIAIALAANRIGEYWLRETIFSDDVFHDNCAGLLTLVLPSFLGGLASGFIAPGSGLYAALIAFVLLGGANAFVPVWRIPLVSPRSAHNRVLHYLLYNPIVPASIGTLGAWLGTQFATGAFTLADRVEPQTYESED